MFFQSTSVPVSSACLFQVREHDNIVTLLIISAPLPVLILAPYPSSIDSMSINMSDPRGASTLRGKINAERHFVLNATTGLASLACSIMEMRDHTKTR